MCPSQGRRDVGEGLDEVVARRHGLTLHLGDLTQGELAQPNPRGVTRTAPAARSRAARVCTDA